MHVSVEDMALQPEQKSGTASKARKKERLMRTSTGLRRHRTATATPPSWAKMTRARSASIFGR